MSAARPLLLALAAAGTLAACASLSPPAPLAPAKGSSLVACEALAGAFAHPRTTLAAARTVPAGELSDKGASIGGHCRVTGTMNERTSPVDGQRYAIGFEMRLPQAWNGRFYYQGNGGVDGNIPPAIGLATSGPGTVLPRAAIADLVGGKTYASLATDPADVGSGFTLAERRLVSNAVLGRCDALDGAVDGMVQDTRACQAAFDLGRDVPTCAGARDGTCLSAAQKTAIGRLFAG